MYRKCALYELQTDKEPFAYISIPASVKTLKWGNSHILGGKFSCAYYQIWYGERCIAIEYDTGKDERYMQYEPLPYGCKLELL